MKAIVETRPTIVDIARRAGVSPGAVSFALNGKPGVSEQTRARIIEIAQELRWEPNRAALSLGGAPVGSMGLVIARPARIVGAESFFAQLIAGLQSALSQHGTTLQLLIVESIEAEAEIYRAWWQQQRVDGVFVIDVQADDPRITVLEALGLPAVIAGEPLKPGNIPTVSADDEEAMLTLVDYLCELGHRRIAHVSGFQQFLHTQRRMKALQDSVQRRGLLWAQSFSTDFSDSQGALITRQLMTQETPRPTAIIYDSDVMAVAGLGVAGEMGVVVPGELSIVSFEDSALNRLTHPAMTALSRDSFELGELLANTLVSVVEGTLQNPRVPATMPVLSVRGSSGAAPK
ncbi:LacI family DNA-binding transcriptional regulator [Lysinibacter sp. HNR]|uniref:LacI family DNA-binding transcriptional regulator n=1 Tax=Lysinibacter sp. HNR TaxID=3031408 RepID=UPI002434E56C|nr:LacI family DNA-binding transcriptional regulator [Lysinibacter sp. HNR]WGD38192.1 LacI family DNA-binding transcriptional regulator [Lysinibacter sp. HNR]